ncbi:MAG: AMP-binding protein, partial [Planctomycetaceae bacterium]|nr:AMP-binding protein [Planctomycetaceae bacterium]
MPSAVAVIVPAGHDSGGKYQYRRYTFAQLEEDSNLLARGLWQLGVRPGTRLALLVRPSYEFVALVFALFKAGAVSILIDPGMGRKNLLSCLDQVRPEGFVAIPVVQAVRTLLGRRFSAARFNVTVGRRWFWRGPTFAQLLDLGRRVGDAPTTAGCQPD